MRILILMMIMFSCKPAGAEKIPSIYEMECEDLYKGTGLHNLFRCENIEVICYVVGNGNNDGGLQCKFKDKQ